MPGPINIVELTHPHYERQLQEWDKWRLTYEGGQRFIDTYLKSFSNRETVPDFEFRKQISYAPTFAKAAINEVKNSIFQRLVDVTREGGTDSYQNAVAGNDTGVDLLGNSMNGFIGRKILPELLTMAKVGVFVDMPNVTVDTLAEQNQHKLRPYIYYYPAEDIRSWIYDDSDDPNEFTAILLRDFYLEYDETTRLPVAEKIRYRHLWKQDGVVYAKFYSETGQLVNQRGEPVDGPVILDIPRIPFVVIELSDSLLKDIANYQIALLNLESSDLSYALKSNFPFYTESFDPKAEVAHMRAASVPNNSAAGTAGDAAAAKTNEIIVGPQTGRRFPAGTERPGFIHPSSEPLKVSMDKGLRMREDIRQLLNLALTNITPKMASAESKGFDERSLESGLSYIGLELETAERKIGQYWGIYENKNKPQAATIHYPEKYSLKSEEDRRKDAEQLTKIINVVPSLSYQKEMAKRIVDITVGVNVSSDTLKKIKAEIDKAPTLTSDWQGVASDVDHGLVSLQTASEARGYPSGEVGKASKDHAERLARIALAQTPKGGARGVADMSATPSVDGGQEKATSRDTTANGTAEPPVRGVGQGPTNT